MAYPLERATQLADGGRHFVFRIRGNVGKRQVHTNNKGGHHELRPLHIQEEKGDQEGYCRHPAAVACAGERFARCTVDTE